MTDARPIVIRPEEATPAPSTPGMDRRQLLERDGTWVGWIRTNAGVAGGWHHHGNHDSYIYVLRGALSIDFGRGGRESVQADAGDFIFNPANLVHRGTTTPEADCEAFIVRLGDGPQVVNTDGPE